MKKISKTQDVDGRIVQKGDMVATLSGNVTARVYDICVEFETSFVCIKPLHHPYSRGVWHAADHVQKIGAAKYPQGR